MAVRTLPYDPEHAEAFLRLYRECLAYYSVPPPGAVGEARILKLLAEERHLSCLLAVDTERAVGFAAWGLHFPSGSGVSLMLKELFVSSEARGKGAGRALMDGILEIAIHEECKRLDWSTEDTNTPAQAFYASIDAPEFGKKHFRIPKAQFVAFRQRLL